MLKFVPDRAAGLPTLRLVIGEQAACDYLQDTFQHDYGAGVVTGKHAALREMDCHDYSPGGVTDNQAGLEPM